MGIIFIYDVNLITLASDYSGTICHLCYVTEITNWIHEQSGWTGARKEKAAGGRH
jgi:hypothetical protein